MALASASTTESSESEYSPVARLQHGNGKTTGLRGFGVLVLRHPLLAPPKHPSYSRNQMVIVICETSVFDMPAKWLKHSCVCVSVKSYECLKASTVRVLLASTTLVRVWFASKLSPTRCGQLQHPHRSSTTTTSLLKSGTKHPKKTFPESWDPASPFFQGAVAVIANPGHCQLIRALVPPSPCVVRITTLGP
ncbi:hypothetical protein HYFRA_00003649 [Hymenoscyphus fraxineus]|uniref:Uncharacterized protein n=1 Tax=Hymenoscyphus fraxineus TaxID=746836 RepID=A0A9N9PJV2_9HELO|nr:hypothetical protein HYFRA_00003649 [Hymenoscyphus fraxineus]